jgi:DNA segregation ATPase FtsK/SpoIIIE-like protein
VDLERPERRAVTFESIRDRLPNRDPVLGVSRFPAGVDPQDRIHFVDLAQPEHAHLLVAGGRGSGKTEWLRSALAALLAANDPDTLRLILIDAAGEAFGDFSNSRFLIGPDAIVNPAEIAPLEVLRRLAEEMDDRCRFLQDAGAENRDEFVARTGRRIPRILFVCDEIGDLTVADRPQREELENLLVRLGKRSRQVGIHLIFATRELGRRMIEGPLNAVFPARIGMRMNREDESFFVLGQSGGEKLLGFGDLLFRDVGVPVRLQAPLVSREDRQTLFGK